MKIGWVGLTPILIVALYIAAIGWFRRMPILRRPGIDVSGIPFLEPTGWSDHKAPLPLRGIWIRFGTAALAILIVAPIMTLSVKQIADATGIAQTFLGVALLAISTSLPELVASLAAIRIGAHDLAVGNLFGSNAANMSVLLFADLAYTKGPILAAVEPSQIVPAVGSILLMAVAIAAMVGGSETRIKRLEPDAIVLLIAYIGLLFAVALAA